MTSHADISVLVVDDEPLIAQAHGEYVGRMPGFDLAGICHGGQEALSRVRKAPVDLVLLDFNLPDLHGLDLCRALRAARIDIDVIAVTSTRDLDAVRSAVSLGVVQYLLKPFTFASFRERLEHYRDYRRSIVHASGSANQSDIDRALGKLRTAQANTLPSGLSDETLERVAVELRRGLSLSAAEVAACCDTSRVTARRYLEYLSAAGAASRRQRHGGSGRPEIEYTWDF